MILKIIGSVAILGASSILGHVYSQDCVKRPQELRVLQGLLQMFENEISFLSNLLTEAFEKICRSSDSEVANIFKQTVLNLKSQNINASQAWESAVKDVIKKTSLNKEDEEILISFGKMLGNSDLEGQIKNIRLTVNQLKMQEQKAEDNRKRNEKMYRSLGVLGGLAIVIILL
ncbi:MAG: stage III sporulation protein SpoIIIAB [Clostridia bacterium]|nr:stage III sporulation protein SpoIIIAB [Clostridia bacterium]